MSTQGRILVLGIVAIVLVGFFVVRILTGDTPSQNLQRASAGNQEVSRDFMFQVNGFEAEGQTLNMYFHYQYNDGIAKSDIPDFRSLRTDAIKFMNENASPGVYWETLSKGMCSELKEKYPIQAISCQLQIYPGRDPGFSSSTHTIGDIEPLAIPAPARGSSSTSRN